ncbi:hypothetical protein KAI46_11230, partial [bacterium]|nr:hypothetical protein [bacterium]
MKAIKKPNSFVTTLDDIAVVNHYAYLDVAAVSAIWDYWKLNDVFQCTKKRDLQLSDIARMLTVNRCIDPSSKSQIPDWFKSTSLQWLLDVNTDSINPSRIFRELEAITEFRILVDSLNAELMEARKSRQREATQKKFKKAAAKYKLSKFVDILLEPVSMPIKSGGAKITTYQGTVIIG